MSLQASRGRDLEERNRALEQELAALQGSLGEASVDVQGNGDTNMNMPNGINGHRCMEEEYQWGVVDMDIEGVQQRIRPHHRRSTSGYNKMDHREGLECLKEVELEFEGEEQRRGRQRERGAPERTAIGRSLSRVRGGLGVGRESGDMEI